MRLTDSLLNQRLRTPRAAAIAGIAAYLLLQSVGASRRWAFHAGVVVIVALRMGGIYGGWHLPLLRVPA